MLSLPYTAYDRILLCLFLVFLTLFWPFLSFQIHPRRVVQKMVVSIVGPVDKIKYGLEKKASGPYFWS